MTQPSRLSKSARTPSTTTGETPTPAVEVTADLPGFAQIPPEEPTPGATTTENRDPGEAPASGSESGPAAPPTQKQAARRSTRVSTTDIQAFAGVVTVALVAVGTFLHNRMTPGDDNDVWLPDEQDAEAIASPLGSLAARRAPIEKGEASDIADALTALVGAAGYALKNVERMREWRAWKRQQAGGLTTDVHDEHAA